MIEIMKNGPVQGQYD